MATPLGVTSKPCGLWHRFHSQYPNKVGFVSDVSVRSYMSFTINLPIADAWVCTLSLITKFSLISQGFSDNLNTGLVPS